MERFLRTALLAVTLSFCACQAMAPGTFSAKGGEGSSTTVASGTTADDDTVTPPMPVTEAPSGSGPSPSATPSPAPLPSPSGPSPTSPPPSSPPVSGSPTYSPYGGPSAPLGPVAAADDPMTPRADKEGAGDCPIAYALTHAARIHYSDAEGSIASIDKSNPTFLEMTGFPTLSAHFFLEALLKVNDLGPSDCSDPTYCMWDGRPVGFVRTIITPSNGINAQYVDLPIIANNTYDETFEEGTPDLHLAGHNVILSNLPAPTGGVIELHYSHNIYKKAMLAGDPMAGNPWAACNVVIGQPPNFSETPAPYTAELQTNFETFRAEGKVHTAAVFKIVRTKLEMIAPQEKPSLRVFRNLSR